MTTCIYKTWRGSTCTHLFSFIRVEFTQLLQLFRCNLGVCDGENNATSCFRTCADDALPLCPNSTVASDVFTPKEPSKRTGVGLRFIQQGSCIYKIWGAEKQKPKQLALSFPTKAAIFKMSVVVFKFKLSAARQLVTPRQINKKFCSKRVALCRWGLKPCTWWELIYMQMIPK